ncbi:uncharacterized protein LOC100252970 isoform X5 [Vitis vinifera]|uniref:uncharacterized protein LOC100252970 isoform X5 n=1 Tax=Vitis vinifera TaxID=29760 RepID=UPI0008FF99D3|nr:uncharacterized protein LOC100252970 isoform X5 [Vitis vinifera]|eukprot:XP_019077394.1 PREDICTED: uncharacterized protein LOC100252970 isoform X6 [Vitis vinifera]
MMENAGKFVVSSSSREEEDAKAKKPRMRLERRRTREEELKVLSDLSVFQNLAAMLEAEKFRKKKKRRRKKKKKNVEVGAQEDGAVNVAKEEKQGGSVKDAESNNLLVSESVVPQKPLDVLTRKVIRHAREERGLFLLEVDSGTTCPTPHMYLSKHHTPAEEQVDAAYEDKANTVIAAETADSCETKPIEISEKCVLEKDLSFTIDKERGLQKPKRQCKKNEEVMSSLDEFKMLSDLSNFKNLAAMMEAEAFLRKKKIKRRKKKKKIEFEAQDEITVDVGPGQEQPDTVKAVTTAKAVEAGSVSVSENINPEKLFVDEVKAGVQPSSIKAVDMRKASETESVSVTKNIVSEKLFVSNFKIDEERISQEAQKKCTKNEEVMSSLDEFKMLSDLSNFKNLAAMMEAEAFMRCKKSKKRRKKKRNMEFEAPFPINVDSVREQKQVDTCKSVDTVKLFQIESIDIKDNIVLQKLLQAPRCFDPPESSWRMCHNSEEEAPTAVACSAEKQKKPCFLCGSFKHSGNHCKQQARNCFVYERSQHTRSCPEKNQGNCPSSMICLRCGGSGHDMLFCRNEYSSDDLKEIQCYVCKRYGHLCCVDFPDIPRQASCYKCGHYGHLGSVSHTCYSFYIRICMFS